MWTAPVAKSEFRLGLTLKLQAMALFLLLSCAFLGKLMLSKYCNRASLKQLEMKMLQTISFFYENEVEELKTKKKRRNHKSDVALNNARKLKNQDTSKNRRPIDVKLSLNSSK